MVNSANHEKRGAMVLLLLAKNYRNQVIALLLRNGVTITNNASDEQIAQMSAQMFKSSSSFRKDLLKLIANRNVTQNLAGHYSNFTGDDDFFKYKGVKGEKVSGEDFFHVSGSGFTVDPTLGTTIFGTNQGSTSTTPSTTSASTTPTGTDSSNVGSNITAPKGVWTSAYNLFQTGLNTLTTLDTNKTNRAIADAQATIAQNSGAQVLTPTTDAPKSNTTMYVLVGLVGLALVGTVTYFVIKSKKG